MTIFRGLVETARPLSQRLAALQSGGAIMIFVGIVVSFLVLYPIGWLLFASVRVGSPFEGGGFTLQNHLRAFSDPLVGPTILNTVVFTLGQTGVSVALGTLLGWIIVRTNTPGRRLFEVLLIIVFLFPLILGVLAWTMLLSPGKGLFNQALMAVFDLTTAPLDIYSMWGMIFVQGIYITPLAFLMIAPAFGGIDASLEESARMCGSSHLRTLRHITLPLVMPAVLSTSILMCIVGIESFDIPQLLGASKSIYTYPSLIYQEIKVRYPPDYGVGTALATSLLVVSVLLVYAFRLATRNAHRFETIKGKNFRLGVVDLGRWRWATCAGCWLFFLLTIILPVMVIVFGSLLRFFGRFNMKTFERLTLQNYVDVFRYPNVVDAFINSLLLAIVGGIVCILLAAVVAFLATKSRYRGRSLLEAIAMLPISFPSTVLGLALLWAYAMLPVPIYGTLMILGVAYVTRYLSIGLRTVSGAVIQLSDEFDEASRIAGATFGQTMRRIIMPLLRPALFAGWLILFMLFIRELGMSVLLVGVGNPVISVVMYDYFENAELGLLSALSVVIIVVVIGIVLLARKMLGIRFTEVKV